MRHLPGHWSGQDSEDGAFSRDLPRMADGQLESLIPAMQRSIDAMQAKLSMAVAEYDRRGLARERHVLTTKQGLA